MTKEQMEFSIMDIPPPIEILNNFSFFEQFFKILKPQNIFFWLSLQSKQKGDQPKTRWKEKHSLSGPWVPRNFCKEIVVLEKEQELKVGAQQKPLLSLKIMYSTQVKKHFFATICIRIGRILKYWYKLIFSSFSATICIMIGCILKYRLRFCNYFWNNLHYNWTHLEILLQAVIFQSK